MRFKNNVKNAVAAIERGCGLWLDQASELILFNTKQNTAVDTGKTRDSWTKKLSTESMEATVGNPMENALWEEFGTGEYAVSENGRKDGWAYKGKDGEFHFTYGKPPKRTFEKSYQQSRDTVLNLAENIFKEELK